MNDTSTHFTPGRDGAGPEHIAAKVARVMDTLNALTMDGVNDHFHYRYLTISQVADALRPLLAEANLAIVPSLSHVEPIIVGNAQKGVTAHVDFSLICGDTGAMLTCRWQGEAFDNQDKAINKAIRAAQKYYLLVTFGISDSSEPEADADPGTTGQRRPRRQAKKDGKCPICQATGDAHAPWCQEVDGQRVDTRETAQAAAPPAMVAMAAPSPSSPASNRPTGPMPPLPWPPRWTTTRRTASSTSTT